VFFAAAEAVECAAVVPVVWVGAVALRLEQAATTRAQMRSATEAAAHLSSILFIRGPLPRTSGYGRLLSG
jgi:hypothetical protein